ncbi:MAG TPA: hypothetical protein VMF32_21385 [Xanthobacteraceae bacterium]|nr:hypothetical protein [Xanthobacteraceae bacterium]
MRDQYAGDVSEFLMFAFLRALVGTDQTLDITWCYAPGGDQRADGGHLEWRDEAAWRLFDEEIDAGLAALPKRSIAALERAVIWSKGALFHRKPMLSRPGRSAWGIQMRSALGGAKGAIRLPPNCHCVDLTQWMTAARQAPRASIPHPPCQCAS